MKEIKFRTGISKKVGNTLWLHFEGRTYTSEIKKNSSSKRSQNLNDASSGLITSPMPGKILKINFNPGDTVGVGQTLCVIEAMKMEYALKAPFNGEVKKIVRKAGDLIKLEDLIMELSEKKDGTK